MMNSPGTKFRQAIQQENPLQIVGTINAFTALQAEQAGFNSIYLSGAGVANASNGMPDLAVTDLHDVLQDLSRITAISELPILVDIDTGWGSALNIERTVREMIRCGAAAVHLEDQVGTKRCGHRPGKHLVETAEMVDRISAACNAKTDPDFVIMARTDAAASEGLSGSIERSNAYISAGSDMIFAEAITSIEDFKTFCNEVNVPVLANMTEFGKTPLYDLSELADAGIQLVLYPLSAFRAMSKAAEMVYESIRTQGHQRSVVDLMQERTKLYDVLDYQKFEDRIDELLNKKK